MSNKTGSISSWQGFKLMLPSSGQFRLGKSLYISWDTSRVGVMTASVKLKADLLWKGEIE